MSQSKHDVNYGVLEGGALNFLSSDSDDPAWLKCRMKLNCPCGNRLSDTTDFLSYKAHLIADQDFEDVMSAAESGGRCAWDAMTKYRRQIYQCTVCTRLLLLLDNDVVTFSADDPARSGQALRSVDGARWRRNLRGHWRNGRGEVWWGFGVADQGYETDFATWEDVEARYFEVFERLKKADTLRHSVLDRDSTTVHVWPAPGAATEPGRPPD